MKNYLSEKGISYHLTVPDTPQQNGEAEPMIRTITEKAHCMLIGADLKNIFWREATLTATCIINITPTKKLCHKKTLLW